MHHPACRKLPDLTSGNLILCTTNKRRALLCSPPSQHSGRFQPMKNYTGTSGYIGRGRAEVHEVADTVRLVTLKSAPRRWYAGKSGREALMLYRFMQTALPPVNTTDTIDYSTPDVLVNLFQSISAPSPNNRLLSRTMRKKKHYTSRH